MSTPNTGRRTWARQLIERATGSRVEYGSVEWLQLSPDDPAKVSSCVVAAECWATAGDTLEDDLRREIEASQYEFKAGEDSDYRQRAQDHRARYGNQPRRKPFLERRKAQLAATQPRPGDHAGGPLAWNNGGGAS